MYPIEYWPEELAWGYIPSTSRLLNESEAPNHPILPPLRLKPSEVILPNPDSSMFLDPYPLRQPTPGYSPNLSPAGNQQRGIKRAPSLIPVVKRKRPRTYRTYRNVSGNTGTGILFPNGDHPVRTLTLRCTSTEDLLQGVPSTAVVCYTADIYAHGDHYMGLDMYTLGNCKSRIQCVETSGHVGAGLSALRICLSSLPSISSCVYVVGLTSSTLNALRTGKSQNVTEAEISEIKNMLLECGHDMTLVHHADRYKLFGCRETKRWLKSQVIMMDCSE